MLKPLLLSPLLTFPPLTLPPNGHSCLLPLHNCNNRDFLPTLAFYHVALPLILLHEPSLHSEALCGQVEGVDQQTHWRIANSASSPGFRMMANLSKSDDSKLLSFIFPFYPFQFPDTLHVLTIPAPFSTSTSINHQPSRLQWWWKSRLRR